MVAKITQATLDRVNEQRTHHVEEKPSMAIYFKTHVISIVQRDTEWVAPSTLWPKEVLMDYQTRRKAKEKGQ